MVLTVYEYQCAFCGYDSRIGAVPVGLEAAHVRWWAFDGPDHVDNGLCLYALHHKLFEKGALGVGEDHRILVSQEFVGRIPAVSEHATALAGRPLTGPQPGTSPIAACRRSWHTRQVSTAARAPSPGRDRPPRMPVLGRQPLSDKVARTAVETVGAT